MNGTITGGASVITPTLILSVEEDGTSGNIVHPILGRSNPDVTLRPGSPRRGVLELGFAGATAETASATARAVLLAAGLLTLVAPNRVTLNGMTFVVNGTVSRRLEPDARKGWTVSVEYQEVTA